MENLIIKNTEHKGSSTISVKVDLVFKKEWEHFCINNNINASATLKVILSKLINGELK